MNDEATIRTYIESMDEFNRQKIEQAVEAVVRTKKKGGRIAVATGSGPNLHEGVTTLIAHLMEKGIVDAVITSSAVVAHEMAGVLDRVKRINGHVFRTIVNLERLPRTDVYEVTQMHKADLDALRSEMRLDDALLDKAASANGDVIIKVAGNMAYPMGLRTERLAVEIEQLARIHGLCFETVAGLGADPRTMIGIGVKKNLPVLVSVPQLVGGGTVGMGIADSMPIKRRSAAIARILGQCDVIIESAVALTQEIHDGPFETYTGHGIWADYDGLDTYRLQDKTLVRIDLDDRLKQAWLLDKQKGDIQRAIDKGLPKTKSSNIPFRMEMSAFARLENSLPIVADIGVVWPILAHFISQKLGIGLDFLSHPQQSELGRAMREDIVTNIRPICRTTMLNALSKRRTFE